ncbi:MAG TPA: ABC transporter permease [Kofleriaceae bacterium]|jgi:ABC-2 type transport system permease protein|nr:ABC transporter permease [Kofleriaceae bacterium]
MNALITIFRRELSAYLRSYLGWIVASLALLAMGVMFVAFSAKTRLPGEMLAQFFMWASIVTGVAGIILSIRLISEERQTGSMVLLSTSPVRELEIVAGKFLAALAFLTLILALSSYIPLLIKSEGKISGGQILIGYVGLFLFGATSLAIGMFASSLVKQQLAAAAIGATILGLMAVLFRLSGELGDPMKFLFAELDVWWLHFERGFMRGVFNLKDVVYYVAVTYFFLLLAVKTLEAKRWQ